MVRVPVQDLAVECVMYKSVDGNLFDSRKKAVEQSRRVILREDVLKWVLAALVKETGSSELEEDEPILTVYNVASAIVNNLDELTAILNRGQQ